MKPFGDIRARIMMFDAAGEIYLAEVPDLPPSQAEADVRRLLSAVDALMEVGRRLYQLGEDEPIVADWDEWDALPHEIREAIEE